MKLGYRLLSCLGDMQRAISGINPGVCARKNLDQNELVNQGVDVTENTKVSNHMSDKGNENPSRFNS